MLYLEHIAFNFSQGIVFKDKNGRTLSLASAIKKGLNRFYSYILDFQLLIVRITGFVPLHFWRVLIYKGAGVKIGKNSHLHMGIQFFSPAGVVIGEGTIVGQNAFDSS